MTYILIRNGYTSKAAVFVGVVEEFTCLLQLSFKTGVSCTSVRFLLRNLRDSRITGAHIC